MMMMGGGGGGGGGRWLFTATQWQELEHQALIYKYMVAGAPVPPDLLLHLRHHHRHDDVDTAPSLAFPSHHHHQPSLGWGCYGGAAAAYGRRVEDPEPGRCRRTDGKKWRCSREAHGESKYCEKHMHRGKNRSRKPVETALADVYRPSALSISPPPTDAPLQLHLDSFHATPTTTTASPPPSYHRYAHGTPLFPAAGYGGGGNWSSSSSKEHCLTLGGGAADHLSLDRSADHHQHDAMSAVATERPLRRFFDDWPRNDGGGERRPPWDGTQLSISIPTTTTASRYNNGDHLQTSE
uniref:Growth-regulating factor n=1 Tax=Leersia perrieri TaxID=77586 RepID=A0A0D9WN20_9ORYZ